MSPFLLFAFSLAATPLPSAGGQSALAVHGSVAAAASTAQVKQPSEQDARTPAQWRSDIREALKRESSSKGAEREAAVRRLLTLYRGLGQPTNLVDTEQRQLRAQLRSRLQRTSQTLAAAARRESTAAKANSPKRSIDRPSGKPAAGDSDKQVARIEVPVDVLAQQIGTALDLQLIPLADAKLAGPDQLGALAELIRTTISPDTWDPAGGGAILAQQFGLPGQGAGFGGPGGAFQAGQRANQAQNADAGQELLELIQHTIEPDSWDINGGPGSIYYFSPLRVLVISQTDEIHGTLGGLIEGLRD